MTEHEIYFYIRPFLMARQEKFYTQEELARRANMKQAAIARFELCRGNPTLSFLHDLAEALEMNMTIELKPKSKYDDFFIELLAKESEFR